MAEAAAREAQGLEAAEVAQEATQAMAVLAAVVTEDILGLMDQAAALVGDMRVRKTVVAAVELDY